jgi:hypothetical protein
MNVWSYIPTIFNQRHALQKAGLFALSVALITTLFLAVNAHAATNKVISFQARLLTAQGAVVPDGHYNIQFNIYEGGTGTAAGNPDGTLAWTETYINNGSNGGVFVKNGVMSVNLGSLTPFGSSVDWDSDTLWLSMNVAGSSASCTTFGSGSCVADGEMLPMKRITAVPFALNAENANTLGGMAASDFVQNSLNPQAGVSFNITGIGIASTLMADTVATSNLDRSTSGALTIGSLNATDIALQQNTAIGTGKTFSANGSGFDGNGNLGIGTLSPARALDVTTNSNTTNQLSVQIKQNGSGDAGIEIATSSSSTYSVGVDASAGSFKISSSRANGSAGATFGATTPGASHENNSSNYLSCSPYDSGPGGNIISISGYAVGNPVAPNNKIIGAIYTDSSSHPNTLVAASAEGTVVNGWNTLSITASLNADTTYWLCFNTNANIGWAYDTVADAMRYMDKTYSTTLPTTASGLTTDSRQLSYYATYEGDSNANLLGNGLFELSDIGEATFKNSEDSANAFNIQSADGESQLNVNNVDNQIKIGNSTGDATLLVLDQSASAPTNAMLGSMYYDTTLGKVQCYEDDGWGACGTAPDTFVTLSPEYSNAVMNGADIGTITSDLCSDTLNINDGSSSQPTICGTGETQNFYDWTSDQTGDQTRSIYVTYQLPSNFKEFVAGSTSLMGRTDSADSSVTYRLYRDSASSGLISCGGSAIAVSSGSQSSWQTVSASGGADPSTCGFEAGESILIRINLTAKNDAHAYVSDLNFTYSSE